MNPFQFFADADLERMIHEYRTELERRLKEQTRAHAKRINDVWRAAGEQDAIEHAKRRADARRSDEELKALMAAKKRQDLMDRAEKLTRDLYPYAALKVDALQAAYQAAAEKHVAELCHAGDQWKRPEPRRLSLSHW